MELLPGVDFVGAQPETFDLIQEDKADEDADELMEDIDSNSELKLQVERLVADPSDDQSGPASPIRTPWPADSLLPQSHFTIDQQACLNCGKQLGYAMPMNREPKVKYLFCSTETCQQAQFLKCFACGNFQSETSCFLVYRPGNSAYQGPSQIYSIMCNHCYADQQSLEPSLEETREQFAKFREVRQRNEERDWPKIQEAQRKEDGFSGSGAKSGESEIPHAGRKRPRLDTGEKEE